jgi:hypothetical protein
MTRFTVIPAVGPAFLTATSACRAQYIESEVPKGLSLWNGPPLGRRRLLGHFATSTDGTSQAGSETCQNSPHPLWRADTAASLKRAGTSFHGSTNTRSWGQECVGKRTEQDRKHRRTRCSPTPNGSEAPSRLHWGATVGSECRIESWLPLRCRQVLLARIHIVEPVNVETK